MLLKFAEIGCCLVCYANGFLSCKKDFNI